MSLLPSSPDAPPDGDPRVVGLDSEAADDLMAALSSRTARRLLAALHEEPAPPGELADCVDTSLQNVQYHLERLENAGAVAVVGTAYSEKGREMQVYGPADSPLVIYAGEPDRASGLRAALSRLFGGFAALALVSLAVQRLFGPGLLDGTEEGAAGSDAGSGTPTPGSEGGWTGGPVGTETESAASTPARTAAGDSSQATPAPDAGQATPAPSGGGLDVDVSAVLDAFLGGGLPPGVAFFLGGATVLTLVVAVAYLRTRP